MHLSPDKTLMHRYYQCISTFSATTAGALTVGHTPQPVKTFLNWQTCKDHLITDLNWNIFIQVEQHQLIQVIYEEDSCSS